MGLFKPDVSLAPLLRLQRLANLQCLHVGAGTVGVLACMGTLTRLHVCAARGFTNHGLLQLTALQGLQELGVGYGFGPGGEDMPLSKRHFTLHYKVNTLGRLHSCCNCTVTHAFRRRVTQPLRLLLRNMKGAVAAPCAIGLAMACTCIHLMQHQRATAAVFM